MLSPAFKPEYNAPFVSLLASDRAPANGALFEVGCGWHARTRWQRSRSHDFSNIRNLTPEVLFGLWDDINHFGDEGMGDPEVRAQGGVRALHKPTATGRGSSNVNQLILDNIEKAKTVKREGREYTYSSKDVILYSMFRPRPRNKHH